MSRKIFKRREKWARLRAKPVEITAAMGVRMHTEVEEAHKIDRRITQDEAGGMHRQCRKKRARLNGKTRPLEWENARRGGWENARRGGGECGAWLAKRDTGVGEAPFPPLFPRHSRTAAGLFKKSLKFVLGNFLIFYPKPLAKSGNMC